MEWRRDVVILKRSRRCLPEGLHLEVAVVDVLMHDRLLERLENGSLWVAVVFERGMTSDGGGVFSGGVGEYKEGYAQGREGGSSVGRESRCCWVQELNKNRAWTSPAE